MLQRIVKISPFSWWIARMSPLTSYVPEFEPLFTLLVTVCLYRPLANVSVWVPQLSSLISSWSINKGLATSSVLLKAVLHIPSIGLTALRFEGFPAPVSQDGVSVVTASCNPERMALIRSMAVAVSGLLRSQPYAGEKAERSCATCAAVASTKWTLARRQSWPSPSASAAAWILAAAGSAATAAFCNSARVLAGSASNILVLANRTIGRAQRLTLAVTVLPAASYWLPATLPTCCSRPSYFAMDDPSKRLATAVAPSAAKARALTGEADIAIRVPR